MYEFKSDRYFRNIERLLLEVLDSLWKVKRQEEDLKNFINADFITHLFEKDVEMIKEKYRKEEISRKETIDLLEKLEEIAENLERYNSEFWDMTRNLENELRIVQEKLPRRQAFRIPIGDVIGGIKSRIREEIGKIAKRGFGILELHPRLEYEQEIIGQKIVDFLEEYNSGVIVATSEIGDDVRSILDGKARFEERNVGNRLLFIVGGQR